MIVKAGEDHHALLLHLKLKHEVELVVKGFCNIVVSTKQNIFGFSLHACRHHFHRMFLFTNCCYNGFHINCSSNAL